MTIAGPKSFVGKGIAMVTGDHSDPYGRLGGFAEAARPLLADIFRGERAVFEDFARCVQDGRFPRAEADPACAGPRFALTNNATLLTRNRRDFDRIPGLKVEDWTR